MIKKILIFFCIFISLIGFISSAGESSTIKIEGDTFEDIGSIIGNNLDDTDISVKGAEIVTETDSKRIDFFGENVGANIKGDLFENIDTNKLAYIRLNKAGDIISADLTASKETVFSFDGKDYQIGKGDRIHYEDGKAIVYGKSIKVKDKASDEFTKITSLEDKLNFDKDSKGNSVIQGNFKLGEDEVNGKATLSYGKISELGKSTTATIKGIECSVLGDKVKISYNDNFNLENCEGNCVNYGEDKISLKGEGFRVNILKDNQIFGKERGKVQATNLNAIVNGGSLEISEDKSKSELAFNVKSEGDFELQNGRTILISEKPLIEKNGKKVLSDKNKLFVKTDFAQGFSNDLSINGAYNLDKNIISDDKGNVFFKGIFPWENAADKREKEKTIELEIKKIEKIAGQGTFRNWNYILKDQKFDKTTYEAVEIANQNKYNVKISPEEFAAFAAHEGWFFKSYDNEYKSKWEQYKENPNQEFRAGGVGLTSINDYFDKLKEGGFIPNEASINHEIVSAYGEKTTKIDGEYLPEIFAGTIAYFKAQAKEAAGEKWNSLTDDERIFLVSYNFNAGHPYRGKISSIKVEDGYKGGSAIKNAAIRRAIYLDLKKYFSFP